MILWKTKNINVDILLYKAILNQQIKITIDIDNNPRGKHEN